MSSRRAELDQGIPGTEQTVDAKRLAYETGALEIELIAYGNSSLSQESLAEMVGEGINSLATPISKLKL